LAKGENATRLDADEPEVRQPLLGQSGLAFSAPALAPAVVPVPAVVLVLMARRP